MEPGGEGSGPIFRAVSALLHEVMPGCVVAKVELNANVHLFKQYTVQRDHVALENGGDCNERWLWHGCRKAAQEEILRAGFMLQKGNLKHQYYGRGTYFAPDPRLSHSYAVKNADHASAQKTQLILSRVACGRMVEKEPLGKTPEEIRSAILLPSLVAGRDRVAGRTRAAQLHSHGHWTLDTGHWTLWTLGTGHCTLSVSCWILQLRLACALGCSSALTHTTLHHCVPRTDPPSHSIFGVDHR
eukprot:3637399-Rhodomonas_salina.2